MNKEYMMYFKLLFCFAVMFSLQSQAGDLASNICVKKLETQRLKMEEDILNTVEKYALVKKLSETETDLLLESFDENLEALGKSVKRAKELCRKM